MAIKIVNSQLKMVIFHSYVSSPEGTSIFQHVHRGFNFCKNHVRRCARVKSWGVASRSQIYNEVGLIRFPALSLSQCTDASVAWHFWCVEIRVSSSNFSDPPKSVIFIGKRMLDHWRLGCTLRLNNTPYVSGKLGLSGVA